MGLNHSPRIVTNGLMLCLDAANLRSYPGSGSTWFDLSGNRRNSTLTNGPTYSTTSFSFDGLNDYVALSASSPNDLAWTPLGSVGRSTITFEMWVRTTDAGGNILSKPWNGGGGYNYEINISGFALGPIHENYELRSAIAFASSIGTGTITQLVCWANSTTFGYSIDGGRLSGSASHGFTSDNPNNRTVLQLPAALMTLYPYGDGWAGNTNFSVAGNVYQFRAYSRVLSAAEIRQNFNAMRGRYGL